jgi:D-tagatose-1,6-bisphosphate aldolase subunit GatZ/KbaZ
MTQPWRSARQAALCAVAEQAAMKAGLPPPVYILGTEVPVPGGADHALSTVEPTAAEAARETIAVHRAAFAEAGLSEVFSRVIAFVVQPGVEFGSDNVIAYDPSRTVALTGLLDEEPSLVFEAHSTDYQSQEALGALVENGFPILKVGPGLTFAYREALYGLDLIASELVPSYGERALAKAMEALMTASPEHWQGYYHGDERALRVQRHFSYSDRIRYYWARPQAEAAVSSLMAALDGVTIPQTVLHQYLPEIGPEDASSVESILIAAVDRVLAVYHGAAGTTP